MQTTEEVLFNEKQKFHQWWLWALLVGTNAIILFGVIKQVVLGQTFGDRPASDTELIIVFCFTLLLTLLFFSFRLETKIKREGIYTRFYPFHMKWKYFPWDSLNKTYVRKYSPISEYGGWGLRYGMFGKGNALNVSGNQGLQLEFTDHKKLLIGTRKPHELTKALVEIGKVKP